MSSFYEEYETLETISRLKSELNGPIISFFKERSPPLKIGEIIWWGPDWDSYMLGESKNYSHRLTLTLSKLPEYNKMLKPEPIVTNLKELLEESRRNKRYSN